MHAHAHAHYDAAHSTGLHPLHACSVKQWAPKSRLWINVPTGQQYVDRRYVDQVKAAHSKAAGLVVCYRVRGRRSGAATQAARGFEGWAWTTNCSLSSCNGISVTLHKVAVGRASLRCHVNVALCSTH